jgi:hypothetical protein
MFDDYKHTHFEGSEPAFNRILFLEIEGVLNSECYFQNNPGVIEEIKGTDSPAQIENPPRLIDPSTIHILNEIMQQIQPTLILTSIWRKHFSLREIESFLEELDFEGTLDAAIWQGDELNSEKNEIIMWCEQETDPEEFLVLDTQDLLGIDNLYTIDPTTGLTDENLNPILDHFD